MLLLSAGTGQAADYVPSSVLASGQWVKVHIDSTSVYRIDYHTLREWGFTEPEKVRVFGYGSVEQAHLLDTAPDDLPPVAVHHSGDALYFYGEGDDRTTPSFCPQRQCDAKVQTAGCTVGYADRAFVEHYGVADYREAQSGASRCP